MIFFLGFVAGFYLPFGIILDIMSQAFHLTRYCSMIF